MSFPTTHRRELLSPIKGTLALPLPGCQTRIRRRAFTLAEFKRILKACGDDTEWRGLVLFGLYPGQRLGDLAHLTWRAVDLDSGEIAFTTRKTGRRIVLPLVQPLADYLASLPANGFTLPCSRVGGFQKRPSPRHRRP